MIKQLNSAAGMKQFDSAPPATACTAFTAESSFLIYCPLPAIQEKRLTHHDISGTIRPTNLKFGRRVPFMEKRSTKKGFCKNRPPRKIAMG
ncbi:hypothetical protein TNCV_2820131 [Trichonephila clavipes]|nr:hypothetical protein TNCV_2820131 [Trichonephila clavipes]